MKRVAWTLVLAAFLMLLLVAPHAGATSGSLSFTLCETAILDMQSGRQWVDEAGIYHLRDMAWTSAFDGAFGDGTVFTGEGSGLLSWNLDTASGNGPLSGEFSWTFHDFRGAGDVTFSGRFNGAFAAMVITNDLIAHAGAMTLKGHAPGASVTCPTGAEPWAGAILTPHG